MPDSNRPSLTEQIDEDEAWLAANRPEWPPELRGDAQKFASLAPKAVDVELPSAAPMTLPPKPNPLVKAVRGALK